MMNSNTANTKRIESFERAKVFELIQSGLRVGEISFSNSLSLSWLESYPGDLGVQVLRSQALHSAKKYDESIKSLQNVVQVDPQFLAAHNLLNHVGSHTSFPQISDTRAAIHGLGGPLPEGLDIPQWGISIKQAQTQIDQKNFKKAENYIQSAMISGKDSPLPAVMHSIVARETFEWKAMKNLLELYRSDWPDTLAFKIFEADILMDIGEEQSAVSLLHECAHADVRGQVISRYFSSAHNYTKLWPSSLQLEADFQIPAAIASDLGLNNLSGGKAATYSMANHTKVETKKKQRNIFGRFTRSKKKEDHIPERLISIKQELKKVAERLSQSHISRADGRYPTYVILTSKHNLSKKYGNQNTQDILNALNDLKTTTRALPNWNAMLALVDDAENSEKYGLTPVKPSDPWAIKNYLVDLDEALKKNGQMVGALLIVGGDDIVPFHRLPNPVDDLDTEVPSDNPYATIDDDYFIPSWPTGRIPDGVDSDPEDLLNHLNRIVKSRKNSKQSNPSIFNFILRILQAIKRRNSLKTNFGYSAQIWQRASHSVFRIIGDRKALSVSPPSFAEELPKIAQQKLDLAYFNLHGLEDTAEWYGQRDPMENTQGPDYPVAMRPQDVVNSGRAPQVVFTEACYGANIFNKTVENALSLKFLASGSKAVVGSTSTSYGSIASPLIAADLLGQSFWKLLKEGYPVGECLRRAKIYLAREMHNRQGYLDGEDQKTLIQFVLYGDPLAQADNQNISPASYQRYSNPSVKTVCDKANGQRLSPADVPAEVLTQVKGLVKSYLPGMTKSQVSVTQEHIDCVGHSCPNQQMGQRANPKSMPRRKVVTLSKQVSYQSNNHPHYARVTFDEQGKVVKLAVSR